MTWKSVTPSFTGDSQHFGGDDGLNTYASLFNGGLDVDTVDINSGWTFRSGKGKFRNPANTFSYTILGAAIAADRNLTLPLATGNDTLAALGTVQTFTAAQTFDTYHDIKQITAPGNPASTYHRIYVDSTDTHLKRKTSAGVIVDYDAAAGGGEVNTVSNIGTAGVGIYKQKTGVNFELKKINAGSAYITITDDTGNNEVDIGIGANVATLNTTQTFASAKTFDTYSDLKQITAPSNPAATYHRLYMDSADGHLKRKDSAGGIKDYDASSGSGGGGGGSGQVTTTYDDFQSTYDITTDDTASPNGKWRCIFHGNHPAIYSVTGTGSGSATLATGGITRYGIQVNGSTGELVGMPLISFTVRLKKTGTPTGNISAVVRNSSDTIVATFTETPAASSLTTSFADVTFTLASQYTIVNGDRILIEFSGASGVIIETFVTDQFNTSLTRRTSYNGSYSESSTEEVCGTMGAYSDAGKVGVRVPAGGAFARVFYEYPYAVTNKTDDTLNVNSFESSSASLVLSEGPYYSDFDVTFSTRTVAQKRGTPATANSWETTWFMFHYNEGEGTYYHHYYLALKSNGTLELGRKDNSVNAEEQYFLDTAGTFSYSAGTWYKIRVWVVSNRIRVYVDDVQKIDFTDDGHLGPQGGAPNTPAIPSSFMYQGKFGLYNEDAEVEFSPMQITVTGALVQAYNYLIYKAGSNYTAQNGVTNNLEFSGSNLQAILVAIETAIPQGGYVRFAPGDFSLTSQWTPTQSNITWMGSGVDVTRILYDMGSTGAGIYYAGAVSTFSNLTANSLKGSKTLTIASTAAYTAGDWIFVRRNVNMQSGVSSTSYDGEHHRVAVVTSGTVLTLDTPLYEDYVTATTSQVAKTTFRQSVTFRDMTIYDNRSSVTALAEDGDTVFLLCKNLLLDNVKFENSVYSSLTLNNCVTTQLNNVTYETPRTTGSSSPTRYGLHVIGATTNLTIDGGSGNRCGNAIQLTMATGTGTFSGRPRNIHVQGMKSYDASSAHYLVNQGVVGATFTNCGAIGSHTSTETGSNGEQLGFATLSPATFIGCYATGTFSSVMAIESDDVATPVGTDTFPQADRTIVSGCRFENVVADSNPLARGIRIGANRAGIDIKNCSFHNIANEVIDIRAGASNINISDNIFSSCAGNVSSSGGYIRILTTASDININRNAFDAGTPSPAARPVWIGTSVTRMNFIGNDVNGLTNKLPTIPAASTGVRIEQNIGLNPINNITNPFNTTNFTMGLYGGTAAAPTSSQDYTIVGSPVVINSTVGTVSQIRIKDGAGNIISILTSPNAVLNNVYLPVGYKVFWVYSSAPTVSVAAV